MTQRVDGEALRMFMRQVPSPVVVVTAASSDGPRGITIGSFASTSLRPPLISFNVSLDAQIYEALTSGGHFAVHILRDDQAALADHFATRDLTSEEQFDGVAYRIDPDGTPILLDRLGVMVCRMESVHRAGDHSIVVGEVERIDEDLEGEPLIYFDRTYRQVGSEVSPAAFEPVSDQPERAGRT